MAIWFENAYATVFQVKPQEKFVRANLSTYRKSKKRDNSDESEIFNSYWNGTFLGGALDKAKALKDKDRIKINRGYVSHEKAGVGSDGKGVYYTNVIIIDFDKQEGGTQSGKQEEKPKAQVAATNEPPQNDEIESGDDLPF